MGPSPGADGGSSCTTTSATFDFDTRLGLVFIVEAAALSAIAVLGLLIYIAYNAATVKRGAIRHWTITTHVHWYFLSMMVSDLVQAVGGIIDVKWIKDATVTNGGICTAQGALKQMGDVGVALASLAIAVHTFCVIVFRWRPDSKPIVAIVVLAVIWLFLILIVAISFAMHRGETYYGNTQYWCWITSEFPAQRIALEYVWMWMAALLNILLYIPIALVLKGFIAVSGGRISILRHRDNRKQLFMMMHTNRTAENIAIKMLFYPAVYTITVLPIAIVRWRAFTGYCVPWAATVASDIVFALSGVLNVLLFTITRPNLLPHREDPVNPVSGASHSQEASPNTYLSRFSYLTPRRLGSPKAHATTFSFHEELVSRQRSSDIALDKLHEEYTLPAPPSSTHSP